MVETLTKHAQYMFSCLAFIVNVDIFMMFPHLVYRNGHGSFVVAYVICLIVVGAPILLLELYLGQFSSSGVLDCWSCCPIFKGIGIAMLVHMILCQCHLSTMSVWAFFMFTKIFSTDLPWKLCPTWRYTIPECSKKILGKDLANTCRFMNTTVPPNVKQSCVNPDGFVQFVNRSLAFNETDIFDTEDLFLTPERSIVHTAPLSIMLGLNITFVWVLILFYASNGIHHVGRIVIVCGLVAAASLAILLLVPALLYGTTKHDFVTRADFTFLLLPRVWLDALYYALCSVAVGRGAFTMIASFNNFGNNILKDAMALVMWGASMNIFAALVVFTSLSGMTKYVNLQMEDLVSIPGTQLVFSVLPLMLSMMEYARVWIGLLFITVFCLCIDVQVLSVAAIYSCVMDYKPKLEHRKTEIIMTICFLLYVASFTSIIWGEFHQIDLYKHSLGSYAIALAFVECFAVLWCYGPLNFLLDMTLMAGRNICWNFLMMLILILTLGIICPVCAVAAFYYYTFMRNEDVTVMYFNCLGLAIVALTAVWVLCTTPGPRLKILCKVFSPTDRWGPTVISKAFYDRVMSSVRNVFNTTETYETIRRCRRETRKSSLVQELNLQLIKYAATVNSLQVHPTDVVIQTPSIQLSVPQSAQQSNPQSAPHSVPQSR